MHVKEEENGKKAKTDMLADSAGAGGEYDAGNGVCGRGDI